MHYMLLITKEYVFSCVSNEDLQLWCNKHLLGLLWALSTTFNEYWEFLTSITDFFKKFAQGGRNTPSPVVKPKHLI